MRLSVRPGPTVFAPSSGFQGPADAPGCPGGSGHSAALPALSRLGGLPGPRGASSGTDNSARAGGGRPRARLRRRDRSAPGRGSLAPFPFGGPARLGGGGATGAPPPTGPFLEADLPLRGDSLTTECRSRETLLHFGAQGFPPEYSLLPPRSAPGAATLPVARGAASRPPRTPTRRGLRRRRRWSAGSAATVGCERRVSASSIFRAAPFDRRVVTHSLAGVDFHDHRPVVGMGRRLSWCLDWRALGCFNPTIGSSRIASSAYQRRPTRSPPFGGGVRRSGNPSLPADSKFENRSRSFRPRGL